MTENFEEMARQTSQTIEEAIAKFEADFEEVYEEFDELRKYKKK